MLTHSINLFFQSLLGGLKLVPEFLGQLLLDIVDSGSLHNLFLLRVDLAWVLMDHVVNPHKQCLITDNPLLLEAIREVNADIHEYEQNTENNDRYRCHASHVFAVGGIDVRCRHFTVKLNS